MSGKRHIAVVAGLLCLSAAVQFVTVRRATVTGLDAVRFVEVARQIDGRGLWETIRTEREQPLFSVLVWIFHEGLGQTGIASRWAWPLSAQLAAATAVVFSVVPVYLLALRLIGWTAACAGSIFFCVLPEVARLGADGISDSTHLFFLAWALWAAIVFLDGADHSTAPQAAETTNHPLWLFPAGVATAFALLTRVEALILPCTLVATLVLVQCRTRTRQPWPRVAAAAGSFAVGFTLIFGPYLAAVESLAPEAGIARMLGRFEPPQPVDPPELIEPPAATALTWQLADGEPMSFAHKEPTITLRRRGPVGAMVLFAEALAAAFGYWIGLLALVGLWRLPLASMRLVDRFAWSFLAIFSVAAFRFAAAEGYMAARHLLPLVVVGIGCAGHGAVEAGRGRWTKFLRLPTTFSPASCAIVLLAAISSLAYGYRPVHAGRLGHRLAAQWLLEKATASGSVLDTRGWTGLYSGRETCGFEDARRAITGGELAYVVLENRELDYTSGRSRTLRRLLDVAAEPTASFAPLETQNREAQTVLVYRWSQRRFDQWLETGNVPPQTRSDPVGWVLAPTRDSLRDVARSSKRVGASTHPTVCSATKRTGPGVHPAEEP